MDNSLHEIFVNRIITENGITKGYVVHEDTIDKDFKIMFDNEMRFDLQLLASTNESYYTFERYCQYVAYIYHNEYGWTIILSDFNNNLSTAIKESKRLALLGWNDHDNKKITDIFIEIAARKYLQDALMVMEEY